MLLQVCPDRFPHRIENDLNPFSPGQLCSRHEITVACHEDDPINKPLVREGRNVKPQFHVYGFLGGVVTKIVFSCIFNLPLPVEQLMQMP